METAPKEEPAGAPPEELEDQFGPEEVFEFDAAPEELADSLFKERRLRHHQVYVPPSTPELPLTGLDNNFLVLVSRVEDDQRHRCEDTGKEGQDDENGCRS